MQWDLDSLSTAPATFPCSDREAPGVRALFYQGLPWKGRETRVFAWLGLPALGQGETCPGMVLVHGGGGTAFDEWVRLWTVRGYAAIAMDLCGCVPVPPPTPGGGGGRRHELGGPAGWGAGFEQLDDAPEDQWPFHAIGATMLAHSLLASQPQVDADRIGVTGISWGGYLTSMLAGVDARFKLAVPVYGCGFYDECPPFRQPLDAIGPARMRRWLALWDPSVYLADAGMPMLWVTGTNDFAYPLCALQKSYRLPKGPRTLAIRIEMPHGHGGAGEAPEEIRVFADGLLQGGGPLPRITGQELVGDSLSIAFKSARPIAKAELCFTRATGTWEDRKWRPWPAELGEGRAVAKLLPHTTVCYMNLFDDRGCVSSSEHVEV